VPSGYIVLDRDLLDHGLWTGEKFSRGQAWVDLIMLANYRDRHFYIRNNRIFVKRGQCAWSKARLAGRWSWSRGKVIRFLDELEMVQQIVQQKSSVITLITITNYEHYQTERYNKQYNKRTSDGTTDGTTDGTHKNESNERNEGNKKEGAKNSVVILPDIPGLDHAAWTAYVNYRKEAKFKKLTKKGEVLAAGKIIKFASAGGCTQMDIVEQSISNGWQGLFEFKGNYQGESYDKRNQADRMLDAIRNLPDN